MYKGGMALSGDDKLYIEDLICGTEARVVRQVANHVDKKVDETRVELKRDIKQLEKQTLKVFESDFDQLRDHEKRIGQLEKKTWLSV